MNVRLPPLLATVLLALSAAAAPGGDSGAIDLLLKRSTDGGRTWHDLAVLHPGPSAYSCLVSLSDREIGCLYQRGEKSRYEQISFARLTLP